MKTTTSAKIILLFLLLLVISCGGGGGEGASSSTPATVATKIVTGVASNGAAMAGTVYLKDAHGTEKNAAIGFEGTFTIMVDNLTPPFLLKAVAASNITTRYSFAPADGTVNINPFTHVAVAATAGTTDLDTYYQSTYVNQHDAMISGLSNNVAMLKSQMTTLFANFNVTDTDFLNGNIRIGQGLDAIFDNIRINVTADTITMYGSGSNQPFMTMTRAGNQMTFTSNTGNAPSVMPSGNSNAAPVANAGTVQSVLTGAVVTLDGSASSDANGDLLTYIWSFTSKPSGSNATLSSATFVKPAFTADVAGTYVLSLVVNDGKVNSAVATVSILSTTNINSSTGSITVKW